MHGQLTWNETESRAARAKISAHDTFPGQICSNLPLISSITSYPVNDLLGIESFSAVLFPVESKRIEASQPYQKTHTQYFCKKVMNEERIIINQSRSWFSLYRNSYPKKAIMEMHPQKLSRQWRINSYMLPCYFSNDFLCMGTALTIKILP